MRDEIIVRNTHPTWIISLRYDCILLVWRGYCLCRRSADTNPIQNAAQVPLAEAPRQQGKACVHQHSVIVLTMTCRSGMICWTLLAMQFKLRSLKSYNRKEWGMLCLSLTLIAAKCLHSTWEDCNQGDCTVSPLHTCARYLDPLLPDTECWCSSCGEGHRERYQRLVGGVLIYELILLYEITSQPKFCTHSWQSLCNSQEESKRCRIRCQSMC